MLHSDGEKFFDSYAPVKDGRLLAALRRFPGEWMNGGLLQELTLVSVVSA
jgi:hypothetical protein